MQHMSTEIAGWAALILAQVYLLKYRLFGAALCTTMAAVLCIANFIT